MLLLILEVAAIHMVNGSELSRQKKIKSSFYIPREFAQSFLVLSDTAEFCYKCADFIMQMLNAEWHGIILKLVLYVQS